MLRASWHDDEIACLDILVFASNSRFAFSGGEGQDLVNGMFLQEVRVSRMYSEQRLEQDALNPMVLAGYKVDVLHHQSLRLLAPS
jgi:hypothetical protein